MKGARKHYPNYCSTSASKEDADEIKKTTQQILEEQREDRISITGSLESIEAQVTNLPDTSSNITTEHQAELDHSRELLNKNEPKKALEYLEKLKARIWYDSQPIVKFRLLTNIGASHLRMGDESKAAKLFLEALQYNPDDEKAILNAALAHFLQGDSGKARSLTNQVLSINPANCYAYAIIVQTYENEDVDFYDIVEKIPETYRTSSDVADSLGRIARRKNLLEEAAKWFEFWHGSSG